MAEKQIVMKYIVEITVKGYGDLPYFKQTADEMMRELHGDVTSAGVMNKKGEFGGACVKITKRKILKREVGTK